MHKLRFLKFYGFENKCMVSHLDGVLFAELRHLEWQQYPLKTLNIHAENLVSLKMRFSKVEQLWDDVQDLVNLKEMDLYGSKSLTKLPDLSQAKTLETLSLGGCLSLMETHSSIQYLNKLKALYLGECKSLTSLPTSIHSKDLKNLELWRCSNLKNFPKITSCPMWSLELSEVGFKELPSSIECLSNLEELYIEHCSKLESISSSIFKLRSLEISNCSNLKRFLEIPSCNVDGGTGIEELYLKECSSLESLPSSLCKFKSLTFLEIIDCQNFKRLPDELANLEALEKLTIDGTAIREVPESLGQLAILRWLKLTNCSELESISSSIFKLKYLESIEISNCSNFKRFLEIPYCNTDGSTGIKRLNSCELVLKECSNFENLPSSLSLTSLEIIDCQNYKRLPDELGNLKALKQLIVHGTAIREVPESLSQLLQLVELDLSSNNLQRIPESLGRLSSLESLVLSNYNLERLPESLNQLSSLKYLRLFENSLEGIPEYLRSLPSKLTSLNLSVDLRNCLKLNLNELNEIVKDGWMKQSFHGNIGIVKSVFFPGNKIPKWFRYQSMESYVTLKTPPADFFNNKILVGFAFCIVAPPPPIDYFWEPGETHEVLCCWKRKSGEIVNRWSLGTISYVESDHVFLGSYLLGSEDLSKRDDEVSFDEVYFDISTTYDGWEVEQCGIHFVYAQDSTESREEEEEEEEPVTH
ncbi:hypothetical protein CUMW_262150 [Citrus unshiu]|uniref:Disease resistance R13L4/SHOC-2-like LRR domain-containing protein n=1 Tax=Citrus unshiu TaxID=55188 RepID=A0A2H5QUD3_CITUN|nr:hypothetical protein CUMW_262150 [Citrus unshiu]